MGLQDRDYNRPGGGGSGDYGEGGGFKRAMKRIFVEGDNFYGWSLPLFTVPRWVPGIRGIEVRIHLLFVVFIVAELLSSLSFGNIGLIYKAAMMTTLFVSVLLHEFGHCVACRWVRGDADQILMWPLGGLAMCRPPQNWIACLITTVGGPAVTLLICVITGAAIVLLGGGWGLVFFNPLRYGVTYGDAWLGEHWRYWLWAAYSMNCFLFAFNVFLPMYPMDSGKIVQELLWSRIGYKRSMQIAVNLGLVLAVVIGTVSLVMQQNSHMFAVCLFCGITCFMKRQELRFMEDEPAWAYDTARGHKGFKNTFGPGEAASDRAYKAALKKQEQERALRAEVDRILDKIREHGMQSLTRTEKATLKDETERTRGKG